MPYRAAAMAPPRENPNFEAIHGNMLREFPALVGTLGGDAEALLLAVGIVPPQIASTRTHATYRQFVALLELAATRLGCPDFGMQLAVREAGSAFVGLLGDGMRAARHFDQALHFLCGHSYAHSLAAWIWRKPSMSGRHTLVGHDILLDALPQKAQAIEYMLLVGNLATQLLTGDQVRARLTLFRHQPISSLRNYRRYFGCEVRFGRNVDAVLYSEHDLACPIAAPDARTYQDAGDSIEARFARHKPPLHANIRGMIAHVLGTEFCAKEDIAARLGLHPRTMARRLAAEATSFQRIKDQVRRDRMLYYIQQTDLDFTAISERLGFSEQAVMTRCCHKWFAMSPTELRSALAASFVPIGQVVDGQSRQQAGRIPSPSRAARTSIQSVKEAT